MVEPGYFDKPPPVQEHISVRDGTLVTDFNEYTFRAPRSGFFAGDWTMPHANPNPIRQFRFHFEVRGTASPSPGGAGDAFTERLPREVLHQILSQLDPCSVVAFAGTSATCRQAVVSMPHFEAVAACPRLLGTVLYLRCRFFTFADLGSCVSDVRCRLPRCGRFGDMLYLVPALRLCYQCWRSHSDWTPVIVPKAEPQLEEDAVAAGIPHLRVLPGSYGSHGEGIAREPRLAFESRALLDKLNYRAEGPAYVHHNDPPLMSYAAAMQVPYYDEHSGAWEEGFLCRACAHQGREFTTRDHAHHIHGLGEPYPGWGLPSRRYTRAGMAAHIEQHGRIFRLTEADGSVRYAHEKPFPKWIGWNYHCCELIRMSDLLQALRGKRFELPQLTPFLPAWYWVPTTPRVPRNTRMLRW